MEVKKVGENKPGIDKRNPLAAGDIKYRDRQKLLKIRVVMTSGKAYVGEFYLPEMKKRLSDSLNDEKLFIALKDAHIEGVQGNQINFIALSKTQIISVEDLSETKSEDLEGSES